MDMEIQTGASMRRILISVAMVIAMSAASAGAHQRWTAGGSASVAAKRAPAFAAEVSAVQAQAGRVRIGSKRLKGLGTVLVNAAGKTLYVFWPDKHKRITCFEECAEIWPPVFLMGKQQPSAAGAVRQSLLGSVSDASVGGRVVTYAGWPLYTYVTDSGPGVALGQAIKLNGGLWYVITPAGKVIRTKP